MKNGAYAGLRLATRANEPDHETHSETKPDESKTDGKKKDDQMADENTNAEAIEQARADGAKAANARFSAVLASEHYAGREPLASALLANGKMTADDIIAALAASNPKIEQSAADGDGDAAARAEMRAAIDETGNSAADADASGGKQDKHGKQSASSVWDQAIALNNPGVKLG